MFLDFGQPKTFVSRKNIFYPKKVFVSRKKFLYPQNSFCIQEKVLCIPKKVLCIPKKFFASPKKKEPFSRNAVSQKKHSVPKKKVAPARMKHSLQVVWPRSPTNWRSSIFPKWAMAAVPSHCPVRIGSNFRCLRCRLHPLEYRVGTVSCFTRITSWWILAIFWVPPPPLVLDLPQWQERQEELPGMKNKKKQRKQRIEENQDKQHEKKQQHTEQAKYKHFGRSKIGFSTVGDLKTSAAAAGQKAQTAMKTATAAIETRGPRRRGPRNLFVFSLSFSREISFFPRFFFLRYRWILK